MAVKKATKKPVKKTKAKKTIVKKVPAKKRTSTLYLFFILILVGVFISFNI